MIEHALAVPMKRFDRQMVGFLPRGQMLAVIEIGTDTRVGQCDRLMLALRFSIPQFDGLGLRSCRIDCGLGELDLRPDDSSERPVSKSCMGATRGEAGSGFGNRRHMLKSPKRLINMQYRVFA